MCFLYLFPLIFAPYFAHLSNLYGPWSGIYVSILSNAMLVSLFKIQADLEDPFDEVGVDDINMDMLSEVHQHMFPN